MTAGLLLPYLESRPHVGDAARGPSSAVIGRVSLGRGVSLGALATLRADGHDITVGDDCMFLDRATVHIADKIYPATIGHRVTVGRFALVHACRVDDDCVIGDAAVIMDNSHLGRGAALAAGALVPPGKTLAGGQLYAGNPARPVRTLNADDLAALRQGLIAGDGGEITCPEALPPLTMAPYIPTERASPPLYWLDERFPRIDPLAYVAPSAVVAGNVLVGRDVSIWFATVVRADNAQIAIGPRSNIQDNTIIETTADRGLVTIGSDVTVGHNVRMGACVIEDECLIGMGAEMADGVVVEHGAIVGARAFVESGTVVRTGHVWAGRPAKLFREVKPAERAFFTRGKEVYVGYTQNYRIQAA